MLLHHLDLESEHSISALRIPFPRLYIPLRLGMVALRQFQITRSGSLGLVRNNLQTDLPAAALSLFVTRLRGRMKGLVT